MKLLGNAIDGSGHIVQINRSEYEVLRKLTFRVEGKNLYDVQIETGQAGVSVHRPEIDLSSVLGVILTYVNHLEMVSELKEFTDKIFQRLVEKVEKEAEGPVEDDDQSE